jgi:hypothetical protein
MLSSNILSSLLALSSAVAAQVTYQNSSQTILRVDTGRYGPDIEEYHYYYDQWPIGLAISSKGRFFVSYTRGNYTFTLGEAVNKTAEVPYPSASLNLPVSQLNTSWNGIDFGSGNSAGFISVQALYITPENSRRPETLWVVDTGRPTITGSGGAPSMPYAQPGGPKIVGINLSNDSVYATYTFPATVHFPDSYMNDIRFDLRPNVTESGQGIAYIVDSSDEGRPGFIMLDTASIYTPCGPRRALLSRYTVLPTHDWPTSPNPARRSRWTANHTRRRNNVLLPPYLKLPLLHPHGQPASQNHRRRPSRNQSRQQRDQPRPTRR